MNEYIILCTEEQTRKAYELGAPLNFDYHIDDFQNAIKISNKLYAEVPTAEEMIGWLESQDGIEEITVCKTGMWIWGKNCTIIEGGSKYLSRKESTLAAIDAALEYLEKAKEE